MALDRESLYAALFARLSLPGFVTVSRRWKHWDDVSQIEQPALFLTQGNETQASQQHGMPPAWKLQPTLYIYCRHDSDPSTIPGSLLNTLITAVEGALEATPADGPYGGPNEWATTLGGLCSHVKIDGQITTDEGILGDQAVCVIPLEILARG